MATPTTVTTSADDGSGSLRDVINRASSGDIITFASSIYNQTITLLSQINISKTVTISGIGANITISGNNASRVFNIAANTTVTINGITIINGATKDRDDGGAIYNAGTLMITNSTLSNNNSEDEGGAIYSVGTLAITDSTLSSNNGGSYGGAIYNVGTLTITDSTLSNNKGGSYGGVIYHEGTLTIRSSILSDNNGYEGGVIYNNGKGTLTIMNSTLSNNNSDNNGGAIYNYSESAITITDSTFSNNTSDDYGGAIYNYEGTLTITNSMFSSNSGEYGGAIYNDDDGFTITNSTFSGNTSYDGGAIYNGYTLTITNSTFSNNNMRESSGYGGGIDNSGTLMITNSTLSGNTGGDYGGAFYNSGTLNIVFSTIAGNQASSGGGIYNAEGNITAKNSLIANNTNSNFAGSGILLARGVNFSTDKTCSGFTPVSSDALKLGPLAANSPGVTETHALLYGSVAIDTVTDCTDLDGNKVTTDQRGVSRPQLNACDAGSYEYEFANITLSPATLAPGTVGISYNAIITASGGTPPYTFSITAGSLPGGLRLSSDGTISGIPVNPGTFNFTITATDKNNYIGSQTYIIDVSIRRLSFFQGFNRGHRRRRRRLRILL